MLQGTVLMVCQGIEVDKGAVLGRTEDLHTTKIKRCPAGRRTDKQSAHEEAFEERGLVLARWCSFIDAHQHVRFLVL